MLEIVYSPDWKALSRSVRRRIIEEAAEERSGRVLIVPEQYSFETERALCMEGGDRISRFAEVLSFSRLAERACVRCGGVARPVLDQGGRIMALARTVSDVRSELKYYAKSARRADFLLQLLAIVDELKSYRVGSRQLARAAERLDGQLLVKTQELALLLEGYETQCEGAGADPRDRLELLLTHIADSEFGRDLRIYVDGFLGFTALETEILGAFLAGGTDVTVALCCDDPDRGPQVFSGVRHTARDLKRQAQRWGAAVRMTKLDDPMPPLGAAALSAFTRKGTGVSAGLRLYECAGPAQEAEAVCADILAYVRAGGRYRDIAVACAAPDELRPVLEEAFERCSIPAFFAGKQPALRTPLLKSTLSALRAACGRMEREDVIAALRSDGAPLSQDECDLVENYAFLWNISGDLWQREWTWNPGGYDHTMTDADRQALAELNELRRRGAAPIVRLRDGLRECASVGDCVTAFYAFLEETGFSRNLAGHIAQMEQAREVQQLQVTRQLYELLINALEQLYSVQADVVCTPEEFLRLMEVLLSQYQVGAIPAVLDAVTVGTCADLQHRRSPILFVCGCSDSHFPTAVSSGSLLNEAERRQLRLAGVSLAPDENEQMDRNLMGAFSLLCAADARLTLSASGQCAWLFKTLCELYPEAKASGSCAPSTDFATGQTLGLLLARGAQMREAPPEADAYARRLRAAAAYDFGTVASDTVRGLYGQSVSLSASRIDRYSDCRFHFFLYDGLGARERKAASFDAPIYGTFFHDVLEKTVVQVMEEGGFHQAQKPRVRQIAKTYMDAFLREKIDPALLSSERFSYLMGRNYDEVFRVVDVLCDELRSSKFEPADCELQFGFGKALPPVRVTTPAGAALLTGAVDRVDLADIGGRTYFRVADYKTGSKDFDFTDILERRGMQMLIYMFALEQYGARYYGEAVEPAGVVYVPAHDGLQSYPDKPHSDQKIADDRQKNHARKGLLLNDPAVLRAMEDGGPLPVLMPHQCASPAEGLMDRQQLAMLRRYVNSALAEVTSDIYSGCVDPNPYVRNQMSSCRYCPFAGVCHLDLNGTEFRTLKSTKAEEFWERLRRKEADHG